MKLGIKILLIVTIALLVGVKIGSMNFYVENCECEEHEDIGNYVYEEDYKNIEDNWIKIVPMEINR